MFKAAKRDKLSTVIVRQIRTAILQGKLKPGEALPTEKELIAMMGVSKHTLREALRSLEGMGLITIKRGAGGGPFVSKVDMATARESFATFLHFQNTSIRDLSEVRKVIEPYLARRAAEDFSQAERDELCAVHAECEELFRRRQNLVGAKAEIDFHVLLAKYTGNPVLWTILDFVNNILAETKKQVQPGRDFSRKVIEAHQKVLDAILAGDGEAAEEHMHAHICEVEDELAPIEEEVASAQQVYAADGLTRAVAP